MLIQSVSAAGVIEDAPTLSMILLNILNFLLSVFGIIAILLVVLLGFRYLLAGGDRREVTQVAQAWRGWLIGVIVVLGALMLLRQLVAFF